MFECALDKKDLEKICAFPGGKVYEKPAAYAYSNKYLIDKMFFYPPFFELYVKVQHGLFLRKLKGKIYLQDIDLNYKYALYDFPIPDQYGMKILTIESPFLFYKRTNNVSQKKDAKGTIVFPMHTSTGFDRVYDIKQYIEELKKLPKEFKPLLICLHYSDVLKGLHEIWYEEGFEVTSAGNGYRNDFVKRFYDILSSVKYATANESTSSLFYAVDMDIPFFFYGNTEIKNVKIYSKFDYDMISKKEYNKLFAEQYNLFSIFSTSPTNKITKKEKEFTNKVLGKRYPKNNRFYVSFILYKERFRFQMKKISIFLKKLELKLYTKYLYKNDIPNHMTLEERLLLVKFAKKVNNGVIVEIGSFLGSNTINLAENSPTSKIYAIDNWKRHPVEKCFEKFKDNVKKYNNIIALNDNFEKIYKNFDKEIDLLIVDGEHSTYKQIKRDCELFINLKKGGIIIIHHYKWSVWVRKYILNYLQNKTKQIVLFENIWIGIKV